VLKKRNKCINWHIKKKFSNLRGGHDWFRECQEGQGQIYESILEAVELPMALGSIQ
jgi:hypothetical protein